MSDNNDELKGAFFVDGNCQIMSKGTITINGATRYASLIKSKTQTGEEIYEVVVSAGRVFYNPPEKKQNEKGPDLSGNVTIDGLAYKFGAWSNVAKSGQNYLGIQMQPKENSNSPFAGQQNQQPPQQNHQPPQQNYAPPPQKSSPEQGSPQPKNDVDEDVPF